MARMRIFEDINIKQVICKVVAGIMIVSVTFLWAGTRSNAYAISVKGKVVAVVKDKEEAERALKQLVQNITTEKRTDIAINETVVIEPINVRSVNIDTEQDVVKALNSEISYNLEAFEILVDGQPKVIVESKDVAMEVLEEVARAQFESACIEVRMIDQEVHLAPVKRNVSSASEMTASLPADTSVITQSITTQNVTESQTQAATMTQETTSAATESGTSVTQMPVVTQSVTNAVTEIFSQNSHKEQKEILVIKEALPKNEEITKVKLEAVTTNETNEKDKPGSKEQKNQDSSNQENNDSAKTNASEENSQEDADKNKKEQGQKIKRELKSVDFNEEVLIKNVYVTPDQIVSKQQAINTLLAYDQEILEYELVEGDNIWDIAIRYGTTMDHILEINPQIEDETRMQIGEKIRLEVPDPIISVATSEQATFKELIPAEIEYVADNDMYKDETKVVEEGYDGLKEITVVVYKVNGKEVKRELIKETVLKEPKTKVFAYGTKERENSYSGNYGNRSLKNIKPTSSVGFMHPLGGAGNFSSGYGRRWGSFHAGIDIAAPAGTPVYAAASGVVTFAGYNSGGYGKLVIIDHGNGQETYYAHNSSIYVNVGQRVSKGQQIAGVGSTGNSTGNHLHFEIRNYGSPINPYSYIY